MLRLRFNIPQQLQYLLKTIIKDTSETLINGIKTGDVLTLKAVQEKHEMANKFDNYVLRLLNKYGYPDVKKTSIYYHIIAQLDRIVHTIKLVALYSPQKMVFSKDAVRMWVNTKIPHNIYKQIPSSDNCERP